MSIKVMTAVWDSDLPSNEKFVALTYADYADDDGRDIFPAVDTVARKTGYSKRQVQRLTRALEEQGILLDDGQGPQARGDKRTNRWRMDVTALPQRGDNLTPRSGNGVTSVSPDPSYNNSKVDPKAKGSSISPALDPTIALDQEEDLRSLSNAHASNEKDAHAKKTRTGACPAADPDLDVDFPPHLRTDEFWEMWQEWKGARKDLKKPLTKRAAKMQLKLLANEGPKLAAEMIRRSITNQWQGLFELPEWDPFRKEHGAKNYDDREVGNVMWDQDAPDIPVIT